MIRYFCAVLLLACSSVASLVAKEAPALILQITVDQLRGDLIHRYEEQLTQGGFRYLLRRGVFYRNAHFGHGGTETLAGHTVIATGAPPAINGFIANQRYDRQTKEMRSDLLDANYTLIGDKGDGVSPLAMQVTAFADELILSSNGKAKAFAISGKDRGAIPLAGYAGKAFWLAPQRGDFISSSYYYKRLPDWARAWNNEGRGVEYAKTKWTLLKPRRSYQFQAYDRQPWEGGLIKVPNTFPHTFHEVDSELFNHQIRFSPAADALTLSFALELLKAEQLGRGEVTDYLSISFSSVDYVGHLFGPSSLEAEDCFLRLDTLLAELFEFVDDAIGLEKVLIVLTGDHGVAEAPEFAESHGVHAQRIAPESVMSEELQKRVATQLGIEGPLVEYYYPPYVYLSEAARANKQSARLIAAEIQNLPYVTYALAAADLESGEIPDTLIHRRVRDSYFPGRSGDIYVVTAPNSLVLPVDLQLAAGHGSPWNYDTFVPIVFAGMDLKKQTLRRAVMPRDIAPTLSAWLEIPPPSGASGSVLLEVID